MSFYGKEKILMPVYECDIKEIQNAYLSFRDRLSAEVSFSAEYRAEMLLAAEGICLMAEMYAKDQDPNLVGGVISWED